MIETCCDSIKTFRVKLVLFEKNLRNDSFSSSSKKPICNICIIGSAEKWWHFAISRPRFTSNLHRSSTARVYDIAFLFFLFLTRRASRTRRGYRWPTSEPISYSSKRPYSQSTTPVGRHEHHYHHPPPLPPPPPPTTTTTTTTTIQEQQHRHHQQSAQLTLDSPLDCLQAVYLIRVSFVVSSFSSRKKKKNEKTEFDQNKLEKYT